MKVIVLHGDPSSNCIVKGSNTFTFGISLGELPSASVTLLLASRDSKFTLSTASMTFTTGNWATPQSVTLTAVADGIQDLIYIDKLQLSTSGGGYTAILDRDVNITDTAVAAKNWIRKGYPVLSKEFRITNLVQAETKRQEMIDFWFNGNGLPNAAPDNIVNNYTGTIHTAGSQTVFTFANLKRLRWTIKDGANYDHVFYGYFFTPVTPNSEPPIICHEGHGAANYNLIIQPFLDAGYYVMHLGMPVEGDNTTTNPSVTNTGSDSADHNTLKLIATGTYDPIHLFVEAALNASNWLTTQGFLTKSQVGISGGGTGMLCAIFDKTIVKSFYSRAFNWHSVALLDGVLLSAFDYENFQSTNSSTRFYNHMLDKQWGDLFLLMCSEGREVYLMIQTADVPSTYSRYALAIEGKLLEYGQRVSGLIAIIKDVNPARDPHFWYGRDATEIMNRL